MHNDQRRDSNESKSVPYYKIKVGVSSPWGGMNRERFLHISEDVNAAIDALAAEMKRDLKVADPPILYCPRRARPEGS